MKISPMIQQYFDIKAKYEDCILFYRVGDFYEMFFDDAELASKELELTLTGKSYGQKERAPMCGVPYHAADTYIHRLVEKGYKVAICEQMQDPSTAKGIVERDVIKIITPGTLTSQIMLNENENNYLATFYIDKEGVAISYCDISTGELATTELDFSSSNINEMIDELIRISAKEIIVNQDVLRYISLEEFKKNTSAYVSVYEEEYWNVKAANELLEGVIGKAGLAQAGLKDKKHSMSSLCALLSYLLETQKQSLKQIQTCDFFELGSRMSLDKVSLRNLEITETIYDKNVKGSLLSVLDKTKTAMGGRLIKKWLRQPLNDSDQINKRLDAVAVISEDPLLENNLIDLLKPVYDFQRLGVRISSGTASGKDLIALKKSIAVLPEIKVDISNTDSSLLTDISEQIADLEDVEQLIESAILEDAPFTVKEGGIIKDGYSEELYKLKDSIKDAKKWIAGLETKERERTGIKTLKVGYNKVFGYYIDVTRANSDLVPDNYIRKQTLVNNERYITPELKETENLVINAEIKINKKEYEIFTQLREQIESRIDDIQRTSSAIATLDVIVSFARASNTNGYVRPSVDETLEISIKNGRHPVIENLDSDVSFVPNDTYLNNSDSSLMIITGPNMSGKSTYMRQTALIVLMAQTGCFVPAEQAHIGVVDRIFTRIGASDNLSRGQSTFYVEMSELSNILHSAKERSLIILDEIGRGTSTYDGLSIAWATVEHLCNDHTNIRTLFATHYHELTSLEDEIKGVKNLNVFVSDNDGDIVFLYKIVPGGASRSYGIHVAKIAGIPHTLLERAENKLFALENKTENENSNKNIEPSKDGCFSQEEQLSLFANDNVAPVIKRLQTIDIMNVTATQAIEILEELKKLV